MTINTSMSSTTCIDKPVGPYMASLSTCVLNWPVKCTLPMLPGLQPQSVPLNLLSSVVKNKDKNIIEGSSDSILQDSTCVTAPSQLSVKVMAWQHSPGQCKMIT